jgi:hypothetical protein
MTKQTHKEGLMNMSAKPRSTAPASDPIDLSTSAAGEEDPGASIAPGDQAPAGTPGTGEDVCPDCGGSGQRAGKQCPTCQGTGKVTVGIGGA